MTPTMTPEAIALAHRHAEEDRALLARLRASGKVLRGDAGRNVQGRARFIEDIESRAFPRPNLAIRPKRKKGKRR